MSQHRFILFIAVTGLISALAWVIVFTQLSPYETGGLSIALFFVTLFMATASFFTVFGFYFRLWLFKNEIFYKHINVSLRQGVLLALIAMFALVFQMLRALNWWWGCFLVTIAVVFEYYFSLKDAAGD